MSSSSLLAFLEAQHVGGRAVALLVEDLVVLVDDGHSQQDTSARADGTEEIGKDGESANAHTAESSGGGDVALERSLDAIDAVALDEVVLLDEHFGDVLGCLAGDLDPGLGEEGAGSKDETEVEDGVEGVLRDLSDASGGRHVVRKASHRLGGTLSTAHVLPHAKDADEEVSAVAAVEKLGEEVEVGHERGLEDDGDVGGVEELDGVQAGLATGLLGHDLKLHLETLEVDDHDEHEDGGEQVGEVGQVGAAPGLQKRARLVRVVDEEVEERDDGTLELRALAGVDGGGAEGLPHDVLADVGGDEEGDTVVDTVALLQELVEEDDDDASEEELQDDQDGVAHAQLVDGSVHA